MPSPTWIATKPRRSRKQKGAMECWSAKLVGSPAFRRLGSADALIRLPPSNHRPRPAHVAACVSVPGQHGSAFPHVDRFCGSCLAARTQHSTPLGNFEKTITDLLKVPSSPLLKVSFILKSTPLEPQAVNYRLLPLSRCPFHASGP